MTVPTPLGRVVRDADGPRLEFERRYDEAIEIVWAALTEPERTARWIGSWSGDPASGTVELTMSAEAGAPAAPVTIHACEPPRRLDVEMPGDGGAWRLEVDLAARDGGGTVLRFTQRLADADDPSNIGPGWHYYLDRFGAELAGTEVPEDFAPYHPGLADAYSLGGSTGS